MPVYINIRFDIRITILFSEWVVIAFKFIVFNGSSALKVVIAFQILLFWFNNLSMFEFRLENTIKK